MEGDVDTRERNRSETTLEDNITVSLLFLKCAVIAAVHDVLQHLLDLRDAKFLSQLTGYCQFHSSQLPSDTYLGDVNLLHLKVIEDIRESLQCDKLARTDILLALTSISVTACQHEKWSTDFDVEVYDL
jgi:hypothetical protein